VRFLHVVTSPETLERRLEHRQGHYMPASLLPSQLQTLEPLGDDEPGVTVSGEAPPDQVLAAALRALGLGDGDPSRSLCRARLKSGTGEGA